MVWGTTLSLGLILFFVKRGKPDNYLQHLAQYTFSSAIKYANLNDRKYRKFIKETNEGGSDDRL